MAAKLDVEKLKGLIRDVPDFPEPGIMFRDVTTLLRNGQALQETVDAFAELFKDRGITAVCAVEARGYIFGAPLAYKLGTSFIPVRKPGKLPAETISQAYSLEYGKNVLELHKDALTAQDRVLIIDDLIATGGSAQATAKLVEQLGAKVEAFGFVIELTALPGRQALAGYEVHSLLQY